MLTLFLPQEKTVFACQKGRKGGREGGRHVLIHAIPKQQEKTVFACRKGRVRPSRVVVQEEAQVGREGGREGGRVRLVSCPIVSASSRPSF